MSGRIGHFDTCQNFPYNSVFTYFISILRVSISFVVAQGPICFVIIINFVAINGIFLHFRMDLFVTSQTASFPRVYYRMDLLFPYVWSLNINIVAGRKQCLFCNLRFAISFRHKLTKNNILDRTRIVGIRRTVIFDYMPLELEIVSLWKNLNEIVPQLQLIFYLQ